VLGAEEKRERSRRHVERFGGGVVQVRRRGDDPVTPTAQRADQLRRRRMLADFDPFVGAAHDLHVRRKTAQLLHRMQLLHAECLAVAHQRARILRMERILHTDGHITRPHIHGATQRRVTLRGHKTRQVFDPAGEQFVRKSGAIFYIFHRRPAV